MRVLLLLLTLTIFSCDVITEWEDVSHLEEFKPLVGKEVQTVAPTRLHGVTTERNYKPVLSYYLLTGMPGISGPEVLSKHDLATGTKLRIKKIVQCVDCFSKRKKIEFEILSFKQLENIPIRFRYDSYKQKKDELFK